MNLKDRFDLVIFDWAGTMVDFGSEAPVKALIEAFGAEGVPIDAVTARRDMGKAKDSSTGYTREMMEPVLARAASQGYVPEHLVCSGETPAGRPSPLMIYKACAELGIRPLSRVVKVDDAEAGIAEGKAAGAFTVGVASGNALGLSLDALQALPPSQRDSRVAAARQALLGAGADLVIDSVADPRARARNLTSSL